MYVRIRIYTMDEGESPLHMYIIIENYNISYMSLRSDILWIIEDIGLVEIVV